METIVAKITASGMSAVHIVRLSGERAVDICKKMAEIDDKKVRYMQLKEIDCNGVRDKALIVIFKSPNSYTGEDVVEINIHGNELIADKVIETAINNGARMAEAGEFTQRAFLNGKIDLSGAEGISDLIKAEGEAQLKNAFLMAEGGIYKKIEVIEGKLSEQTAKIEVSIDYPEEELEQELNGETEELVTGILKELMSITAEYDTGAKLRDGVRVAIIGSPNVGKSSLLNALISRKRAIVSSIAGTTRDTIEESYIYAGVKYVFIDTAGIRETAELIEREGIERAREELKLADIVLSLSDSVNGFTQLNGETTAKIIRVLTKADINNYSDTKELTISSETGNNIDLLKEKIANTVKLTLTGGARINNLRQLSCINNTISALTDVLKAIKDTESQDIISSLLSTAITELGKLTGKSASEQVISQIFSAFCVGK